MTEPCRSDCPGGDCAGCAFPPRLPRDVSRCAPSQPCRQSASCARCTDVRPTERYAFIDATGLRHSGGAWCPMFIDARGVALEAA